MTATAPAILSFVLPLAESYLHRLDPVALPIHGDLAIRWYGLAYLAGFVIGWLLLRWLARSGRSLLAPPQVIDFVTAIMIGVLAGGRIGHALFYEPHLFWTFSSTPPWWSLLAIHKGGMSSHGGILGVLLACLWFARRHGVPALHLLDLIAFVCPPGLGLGRLANFVNGELWGRPLPTSMHADPPWWSIKYPSELLMGAAEGKGAGIDPARLLPLAPMVQEPFVVMDQRGLAGAIHDAVMRGRADVIERVLPLLTPHYPSQIFQAITDGVLLPALLVAVWWRPRKAGVVAAWFLIGYGLLRFASEQFREPDAGVFMLGRLTLPMLLSLGMAVIGAVMLFLVQRRPGPRLGGLRPEASAQP